MRYLSVCSGIEAASVAWHPLGWTPIGFSEIEPFPSAVLAHHYPKVKNYGDMSKFRDWSIRSGDIDLLVGGTPCQSFSIAGLRQGLKDPRGNLMLTFLAISQHLKPKWILWENVPGVLSSNGGRDFASFLGALGQLGYGFAYRVLDAQWCRTHGHPRAVPQRRRRVFVVGCLGDQRSAAKVLFESESLQRYSAKGKATRQGTAADVDEGVGSDGELIICQAIKDGIPDVCATIDCGLAKQVGKQLTQQAECFYFPIVIPIQDSRVIEKNQNGIGVGNKTSPAYTIDQTGAQAVAIQGTVIGRQDHNGPQGSGCSDGGEMFTLNSTDVHAVAVAPISMRESGQGFLVKDDIAGTLRAEGENRPSRPSNVISQTMQVRRLTPTECERLQGFPDGWTAIPWKKKLADDCPDGPRYKALGNSMAVNCMEWLGERIQKFDQSSLCQLP